MRMAVTRVVAMTGMAVVVAVTVVTVIMSAP